jgi:hypothetical protein
MTIHIRHRNQSVPVNAEKARYAMKLYSSLNGRVVRPPMSMSS